MNNPVPHYISLAILLVSTATVLATDIRSKRQLPSGFIWIISTFIYGGIGIVIGSPVFWFQGSIDFKNLEVSRLAFDVFAASVISFSAGYNIARYLLSRLRLRFLEVNILLYRATRSKSYILALQLILLAFMIVSALLDLPDRYNSYPSFAWPGKFVNSLSILVLIGPAAFFCLGRELRAFFKSQCQKYLFLPNSIAILNVVLVLKTGSRSICLGLLLSFLAGFLIHSINGRELARSVLVTLVILVILIPLAESLRIARSNSDFYRANPVNAANLLRKSFSVTPDHDLVAEQLNRHPLDEAVYRKILNCRASFLADKQVKHPSSLSLGSTPANHLCDLIHGGHIGFMYWPSLTTLPKSLVSQGSSIFFPSSIYLDSLRNELDVSSASVSIGEAPSLRADSYYRFGLLGVCFAYISLGVLFAGYNCVAFYLLRRSKNLFGCLMIALLPLTLLTGNLSLGILTQFWLVFIQLPKNILIVFVVGGLVGMAVKSFDGRNIGPDPSRLI